MPKDPVHYLMVGEVEGVLLITFLVPKIFLHNEEEIGNLMYREVGLAGNDRVLLNLCQVECLCGQFMGKLIILRKRLGLAGKRLKLCCLQSGALEVFRISRLDQIFEIHDDQQSAIDSF